MGESNDSGLDREARLDAAFAEYLQLVDLHGAVDRAQFIEHFPDLAEELSELLGTAERVEHMAGPRSGHDDSRLSEVETPMAEVVTETAAYRPEAEAKPRDADIPISQDAMVGRCFGDYEILREIGHGGMGVVYMARQIGLDRIVALKMIRAGILASENDVRRFQVEARAAAKLGHPNIVQVHQVGELDGQHFYTMEYVEGNDLAKQTRAGALPSKQAAAYVKDVAAGVYHAHGHGIIHRDLKPANIILDSRGRPRISDFGLAKDIRREKGLTDSGTSIGTPSYMSPEQAAAKLDEVAAASDIYSLGAILYELLTGQPPFKSESTVETLLDVIHNEPPTPRSLNPKLDRRIESICLKCLNKDPAKRYATAHELSEDLERYLSGDPVFARPVGRAMKSWYWLRDVPLIAAVAGRRITTPTRAHRSVQWIVVALATALLSWGALALWTYSGEKPFPSQVRIATGNPEGEYHAFGEALAGGLRTNFEVPVEVLVSDGAVDNRQRLLGEDTELGLLQAGAVSDNELAIVAPLYSEAVYFVVRAERGLSSVVQLGSKKVAIGPAKSGMQLSARHIFDQLEIEPEYERSAFSALAQNPELDAAVITTGPQNAALKSLLRDPRFRLLSLSVDEVERLEGPMFRRTTVDAGALIQPDSGASAVPPEEIRTVKTPTFLVARRDASSEFIREVLETLYASEALAERFALLSRKQAALWTTLPLHPAAREFFTAPENETK